MDLTNFIFEEKQVTIVMNNNEPWFYGNRVAEILGYSNTPKAVTVHVREKFVKLFEDFGSSQNGRTFDTAKNFFIFFDVAR